MARSFKRELWKDVRERRGQGKDLRLRIWIKRMARMLLGLNVICYISLILTLLEYRPVYRNSIRTSNLLKKKFNYKQKNFKTVIRKSDPVKRMQQLKKSWKKNKFLQYNTKGRQGRKLKTDKRINDSRPDFVFYRYVKKTDMCFYHWLFLIKIHLIE